MDHHQDAEALRAVHGRSLRPRGSRVSGHRRPFSSAGSTAAEGPRGLVPPPEVATMALAIQLRPRAALPGSVQLEIAVHVAGRAGGIEVACREARAQPLHAVAGPDLEQAALAQVADPQVGYC